MKESFRAFNILNEFKIIKDHYCKDCQYLLENKCELKRKVKQCLRDNKKNKS